MIRFVDVYLDPCIPGYPCVSSPRWSTEIVITDSGAEQVNRNWANPLHRFTLPEAVRNMATFNAIRDHWLVMGGPAQTWPWRDPLDFASVGLQMPNTAPTITGEDQIIGTGDGVQTQFQITKTYTRGVQSYSRLIHLPIISTVAIIVRNAFGALVSTPAFTISRPGGIITFVTPIISGYVVRAGYLFDCEVRFESDNSFDGIVRTFGVGGFADISLYETRNC